MLFPQQNQILLLQQFLQHLDDLYLGPNQRISMGKYGISYLNNQPYFSFD